MRGPRGTSDATPLAQRMHAPCRQVACEEAPPHSDGRLCLWEGGLWRRFSGRYNFGSKDPFDTAISSPFPPREGLDAAPPMEYGTEIILDHIWDN